MLEEYVEYLLFIYYILFLVEFNLFVFYSNVVGFFNKLSVWIDVCLDSKGVWVLIMKIIYSCL